MNYKNLYITFIFLIQCMWEIPKFYYMIFSENYHLFPMIPNYMPISNSPRLWLILHLFVSLTLSYKLGWRIISQKENNIQIWFGISSLLIFLNCWNFGPSSSLTAIYIQVPLLMTINNQTQKGNHFVSFFLLSIPSVLTTGIVLFHWPYLECCDQIVLYRCVLTGIFFFLFEMWYTERKLK